MTSVARDGLPLLVLTVLLFAIARFPDAVSDFGYLIRDSAVLASLLAVMCLAAALSTKASRRHDWVALALLCSLLLIALYGTWQNGVSDPDLIAGLLPFSDAAGYYVDAARFLDGHLFSPFSGRRPLFASLLSSLLGVSGRSLRLTVALLTLGVALCSYVWAREVRASAGKVTALVGLGLVCTFYNRFIGVLLTEQLGLMFGLLGSALLLRAAYFGKRELAVAGILVLGLGLNARAGAFLILPALVVWFTFAFGRSGKRFRTAVVGSAPVLLAFLLNYILFKTVVSEQAIAFGNLSYTLYGLAVGGKGWAQIQVDHPEILSLSEPLLSRTIYELAWAEFAKAPHLFLVGMLNSWVQFFTPRGMGAFGFLSLQWFVDQRVWDLAKVMSVAVRTVFLMFLWLGAWQCWKARDERLRSLLLWSFLGIVGSTIFAPPTDSDQMRVFAATIPFQAVLAGVGSAVLLGRVLGNASGPDTVSASPWNLRLSGTLSILLVLGAVVGPVVIRSLPSGGFAGGTACAPGEETIYHRLSPGSRVQLLADSQADKRSHPVLSAQLEVTESRFRSGLAFLAYSYPAQAKVLGSLTAGTTLMAVVELGKGRFHYVAVPTEWLVQLEGKTNRATVAMFCGRIAQHEAAMNLVRATAVRAIHNDRGRGEAAPSD